MRTGGLSHAGAGLFTRVGGVTVRAALLVVVWGLGACHKPQPQAGWRHGPGSDPSEDSADTAPPPVGGEPFTVAVLPDTQVYAQDHPEIFSAQTAWIAENRDAEAIAFVLHEGDITNNNSPAQWDNAAAAMALLDGVVPCVMAAGNHDIGSGGTSDSRDSSCFNATFPLAGFQTWPSFHAAFEENASDNVAFLIEAGGLDWLVFALEFGPRDVVLDWVHQVASQHPDHPVVLVTHAHVYSDETLHGTSTDQSWNPHDYALDQAEGDVNDGVQVWQALQDLPNLAFLFNGHVLNDGAGRVTGTGSGGNVVHQMLANYQMLDNGGDGWMRLLRFQPGRRRLDVQTFSPTLGRWNGDVQHAFSIQDLEIFSPVDAQAPQVESLSWLGGLDRLALVFDETLDPESAADPSRYTLDCAAVEGARLEEDGRTVSLQVADMPAGQPCTLSVNGVKDASKHLNRVSGESWTFTPQTTFQDDFGDGDLDGWQIVQAGTLEAPSWWEVSDGALVQRSNVYGDDASATSDRHGTWVYLDDPFALAWTDTTFSVTLRSEDNDGIGVLLRAQPDGDHYRLDLDSQRGFRKLVRVLDGQEVLLAQDPVAYTQGAQMRIQARVQGSRLRVEVDGEPLFGGDITDDALPAGTVGLWCWGNEGCWYDDVEVEGFGGGP